MGERDCHHHVEEEHGQPETLPRYAAKNNASEDNVPGDHIAADKSDVPNDVYGDHTHPDEGGVPKTPEEGDADKSLDRKMSKKLSQRTTLTFQAETSAGMTKNQLAEPAGKEPKTTVNSAPRGTDRQTDNMRKYMMTTTRSSPCLKMR
jgi:hypothetical protein